MAGLILWGTSLFVIIIFLWQVFNEAKFKKNLVLGVTLPFEAHDDPQVLRLLAQYKRNQWIAAGILTFFCVVGAFIQDIGLSMSLWSIHLLLCMFVPSLIMALTNHQLKQLKESNGWVCKQNQLVRVDTATLTTSKKVSFLPYLIPLIVCFGFILFDQKFILVHFMDLILVVLCFLSAKFLYRNKAETVDGDSQLTKNLSELRRKRWNLLWLISAYSMALGISVCIFFTRYNPNIAILCLVLLSLLFCGAALFLEMQTRHLQEKLTANSGKEWYVDDDIHWPLGMFYYNPNDSHILINQRVGTGSTVNLATKTGKAITIFSLLLVLLLPVIMIPIANMDKGGITLNVTDTQIVCESGHSNYTIPFDEIEEAQLSDTLPESLYRVWGTGMPHLISGSFSAEGMNSLTVLADPTVPPYIIIKKTSGSYALFGSRDPQLTTQVFEQLPSSATAS